MQYTGVSLMEYKCFHFELVETTNPYGWKWTVFVDSVRTRTGVALTRADAVLDAECAIDNVLETGKCSETSLQQYRCWNANLDEC